MEHKRVEVTARRQQVSEARLLVRTRETEPPRGFLAALTAMAKSNKAAIIAEVKQASPSRGRIVPEGVVFDAAAIAEGYAQNGAACLSCLTDERFFRGRDDHLRRIRDRVALPVLRKDFFYDPYQVLEARAMGADAILLIMAILSVSQALELESTARELGMELLAETHDEAELDAAHALKTPLLGINNRNLKTFETTLETSVRLACRAEDDRFVVSESGIHQPDDIRMLQSHGIQAFLIGEAFMRERDPGAALGVFLEGLVSSPCQNG